MPKIIINRISEYENRARKIKIEIDGTLVAKIKNGETCELEVSAGKHHIQAKIDWCTSNLLELETDKDSEIHLELRKGLGSALYRTFFGYKAYLQLIAISR